MQTPRDMLAELWTDLGGERAALDRIVLTGTSGEDPAANSTLVPAPGALALVGIAGALLTGSRRRS